MDDLIGSFIVKMIPWIIPILLVVSFLMNTKSSIKSGGEGEQKAQGRSEKAAKTEKPEKSSAPAKALPKASKADAPEVLDAGISDKDMTE